MIGLGDSEGQRGKGEAVRGSGHGARMSLLQLTLVAPAEADGALRERPGGGATERGLVVVPLGETERVLRVTVAALWWRLSVCICCGSC